MVSMMRICIRSCEFIGLLNPRQAILFYRQAIAADPAVLRNIACGEYILNAAGQKCRGRRWIAAGLRPKVGR
jgi:hypothetical protein